MLTSDLPCIASILRTYERKNYATPVINPYNYPYGTCQKLAEGGSQLFETAEKGGVMKNGLLKGGGTCKYVSVIM